MFDIPKAIKSQKEYCEEESFPHFAPNTGRCWKCNKNIYEQIGWKIENGRKIQVELNSPEQTYTTGITVEKARNELVTGCPHCNRSYCD